MNVSNWIEVGWFEFGNRRVKATVQVVRCKCGRDDSQKVNQRAVVWKS